MNKRRSFEKILKDIRDLKIQGAQNVAKKSLEAYYLFPTKASKKKILSLRPTEPLTENVLNVTDNLSKKQILNHFKQVQENINYLVKSLIKSKDVIFTHCHSSTVVKALIFSKKKGKKFEVYNTETRPLFQGRKTSRELRNAGIKVTQFVDSALGIALSKEQGTKKVDMIFLGADAISKKGVANKVGSEVICQVAKNQNIPVYIVADSWKFTKKKIKLEQRNSKEVWKVFSKKKPQIENPAFEFIPKKYIKAIISEKGILSYKEFLKKV